MATNNRNGNQSFKQIEGEGWLSTYLPAISAGTVMAIVLFLAISCSKKSNNSSAAIKAPESTVASSPAPAASATSVTPEPPKRKKPRKARPANATYVNEGYGVSFSYPRKYSLQAGDGKSSMPVTANFVKPGAVEIASVDMPDSMYTDTDFSAGLLNISVNPGLTEQECTQFMPTANASSGDASKTGAETGKMLNSKNAADDGKSTASPKAETVKLGSNQFTVIEQMNGATEHQSDTKYFHTYKNGACYEFALDVDTSRKADEELAQVDRGKVFQQLAKILTTARIKEVQLPGLEAAQKPAADSGVTSAKLPETATTSAKSEVPDSTSASANLRSTQEKNDQAASQPK